MIDDDLLHRRLALLFPFRSVFRAAWRASPLEVICLERMINRALGIANDDDRLEMREMVSAEVAEGRLSKLFFPTLGATIAVVVDCEQPMVIDFAFESEMATRRVMTELRRLNFD